MKFIEQYLLFFEKKKRRLLNEKYNEPDGKGLLDQTWHLGPPAVGHLY